MILRVLRALASTRKRLTDNVLRRLILFYYVSNPTEREVLLGFIQSASQVNDRIVAIRFDSIRSLADGRGHGEAEHTRFDH